MSPEVDAQLEADFAKNPQQNFRALFDRFSSPLLRFLYRFTGNAQASEEILQDIFLELLNGRYVATTDGTLKAWLFTVAKNRGLNHRKRTKRNVSLEVVELRDTSDIESETIFDNLLQHLAKTETELPKEIRETWDLRKRGLDNQQIAEALSIPVGTVKSRFSRLVDYLRKDFL